MRDRRTGTSGDSSMERLLSASCCLFWSYREDTGDALRGHAYLLPGEQRLEFAVLVHSEAATPRMLELLDRWKSLHRAESDSGRQTDWRVPDSEWRLCMDAGAWQRAVGDRPLSVLQVHGPDAGAVLAGLPLDFLRAPVPWVVRSLLGDVAWPRWLSADVLRPGFAHALSDETLALTACRYGSRHADAGQDRTAAVFLSRDGGRSWMELSWKLPLRQRFTPSGRWSWPPEQIDRVWLAPAGGVLAPVIDFEDPWSVFEPGREWRARWRPGSEHWVMEVRKREDPPPAPSSSA
jgi:hypothetical protein